MANTETNLAHSIPFFGWMLRDMKAGHKDAPYWFLAVMVLLWAVSCFVFGFAALVAGVLILTPIVLIGYAAIIFAMVSPEKTAVFSDD